MSLADGRPTTPASTLSSEEQRKIVKEKMYSGEPDKMNPEISVTYPKLSVSRSNHHSSNVKHVDVSETQGNFSHMVVFIPQTRQTLSAEDLSRQVPPKQRPLRARASYRSHTTGISTASLKTGLSPEIVRSIRSGTTLGFPPSKSIKASLFLPSIPEHEDPITSKAWLRLYSLHIMNLDLHSLLEGPDCEHADDKIVTVYNKTPTKYCYMFPSINVNGVLKHLRLSITQLEDYERQMDLVLRRYLKRLIWLLSGSRRIFGTMVHQNCVILIDTSGSMTPHIEYLKKELVGLIWEQFYSRGCSFNLMCFSGHYEMWSNKLESATQENCHSAMDWVLKLKTCGSSKTLDALKIAFEYCGVDSVYLLTDGKPDTSTPELLSQVTANNRKQTPVNTISFNCNDITANRFLQALSTQTGGRYHKCRTDFDAKEFTKRLMEEGLKNPSFPHLPAFESDDLSRLGQEISISRKYLQQVKQLRELYGQTGRDISTGGERPSTNKTSNLFGSKTGGRKSSTVRSQISGNYNFFKDAYWVPGVWRTFWKYPPPKHVIAGMIDPLLPQKEEQITTEKWLTMYMLSMYRLHLKELVSGEESTSRYSDIYAKFRVGGEKKYLRLLPQELIYYEILMERVYKRYLKRLHWLLTSSRLVFGTVIHTNCVIVVDTSGSMGPSMDIMKKALVTLIWEQIFSQECMFTLVDFSANALFWKEGLQSSTKENCEAAIAWVSNLKAEGGTNTLEAIQCSLKVPGLDSVYLLSDGEPKQPPEEILQAVETQFKNCCPVNTISFNCKVDKANNFLEALATQTGGRYHRYLSDSKGIQVAPILQTRELEESDLTLLSQFEGDDLRKLVDEIKVAKKYLYQVRQYRALSKKKEVERPLDWVRTSVWPKTKVHKFFVQRPATQATFVSRPKSAME